MEMPDGQDRVSLRDVMNLQERMLGEIHAIRQMFEAWKVKVIVVSIIVSLIVSLGVKSLSLLELFKAIF